MQNRSAITRLFISTCRFFGYANLALSWLWVGVLLLPLISSTGVFETSRPARQAPLTTYPTIDASPFTTIIALIIVVLILALTICTLLKLPRTINRTAEKTLHAVSNAAIPVITHHKTLPIKKKRALNARLIFTLQVVLLIIPLVLTMLLPTTRELTREVVLTISSISSISGLIWFSLVFAFNRSTSRIQSRASHESR